MAYWIFLLHLLGTLLVCARCVMGQGDYVDVPLESIVPRRAVHYTFDNNSTARSVCPTIIQSDVDIGSDIVLQPNSPTANGSFSVRDDRDVNKMDLFNIKHCRCPCFQDTQSACDQLVIQPLHIPTNKEDFDVRYTPGPGAVSRVPIEISVQYGPAGIVFDGDVSNGRVELEPTGLEYKLRVMLRDTNAGITVCENVSGVVQPSTGLINRSPMENTVDCIPARDGLFRGIFSVRVTINEDIADFGSRSVFLTHAMKSFPNEMICEGSNILASTPLDVIYSNITEPPITTDAVTTDDVTTDDGGDGGGGGLIFYIVIPILVLFILVAASAICIFICFKRFCSNSCRNQTADFQTPDKINNLEGGDKTETPTSNFYVEINVTPVSSVAFMTAEHTSKYQELMTVLLKEHGDCKRVSLINTIDPTRDDYVNSISRCLKTEEECLVYIIWNGSLESINQNRTRGPPIKDVIRSFSLSPLKKQSHSVMHRLILLQLGSKGDVDSIISPQGSITVCWNIAGDDNAFNPRECGEYVCRTVMVKLNDRKVPIRQKKLDNELLKVKSPPSVSQNQLQLSSESCTDPHINPAVVISSETPPPSYQPIDTPDHSLVLLRSITEEVKRTVEQSEKKIRKDIKELVKKVDYGNERLDDELLDSEAIQMNNMDPHAERPDPRDGDDRTDEDELYNNQDKKRKTTML